MLPTDSGATPGRVAENRPGGVRCLLKHCIALFATCLLVLPQAARAEYPDRPIRIVSPWPAGGSGDLVARVFADFLARKTGAAVVVENRTGGNGGIGSTAVARAAAPSSTRLMLSGLSASSATSACRSTGSPSSTRCVRSAGTLKRSS